MKLITILLVSLPQFVSAVDHEKITIRSSVSNKDINKNEELPYTGKYWRSFSKGVYVDLASGEALFISKHQLPSERSGRIGFFKTINPKMISLKTTGSFWNRRTKIHLSTNQLQLGYLVHDGLSPTGFRFSLFSEPLQFVPYDKLKDSKYSYLLKEF